MIADTTFLVDVLCGQSEAVRRLKDFQAANTHFSIPTPSIVELWGGLAHAKSSSEREELLNILASQIIYDLDKESAIQAGEIYLYLIRQGRQIDLMDIMIAGIALRHNEVILTRNSQHCGRIPGIAIETY